MKTTLSSMGFGILLLGCSLLADTVADLPADYRTEIVRDALAHNPDYRDLVVSYSDPAPVLVSSSQSEFPPERMTAVLFEYMPHSPDGSPYLMVVRGIALYKAGVLVRVAEAQDPSISWPAGRPRPHEDSLSDRAKDARGWLAGAEKFHDPQQQPMKLREIRQEVWRGYGAALEKLRGLSKADQSEVIALFIDEKTAPLVAEYQAAHAGIDPFSGEMNLRVTTARDKSHRALVAFLGEARLSRLQLLSAQLGEARVLQVVVGPDLEDAGMPFSADQLMALAQGKAEHENEAAFHARAERVLRPEQLLIFDRYYDDQTKWWQFVCGHPGGGSAAFLQDPVYGSALRRVFRRYVLKDYAAAVAALHLPPDREREVKDLLVERNIAPREAGYAAETKGGDRATAQAAREEAIESVNDRLKAALEPGGLERLEDLREIERRRGSLDYGEGNALAADGEPLTDPQLEQLTMASWEIQSPKKNVHALAWAQVTDPATGLNGQDLALLEKARSFLSPGQETSLKYYLIDMRTRLRK